MIGFLALGIFWVSVAPHYVNIEDYFNAGVCVIALPLFGYFAYNEFLSKKWDEDPEVMHFLAGSVSIATLIYFTVQRIPIISGTLVKAVAEQTTWITTALGYDFYAGPVYYGGSSLLYTTANEGVKVLIVGGYVSIVLACTGLQVIAAATAMIWCTSADTRKRLKSFLVVVPTVYVVNLFRNAFVIYLTVEGIVSFETAHHEIAKTASVIVLIILLLIVFEMMPELHENIMSILALPKRGGENEGENTEE